MVHTLPLTQYQEVCPLPQGHCMGKILFRTLLNWALSMLGHSRVSQLGKCLPSFRVQINPFSISLTSPGFYASLSPTVFSTHLEKFLPFSSKLKLSSADCFSLDDFRIYYLEKGQLFTTHSQLFTTLKKKALEDTVGKEDADNQHFLLFPPCFSLYQKETVSLRIFNWLFTNVFYLVMSKILSFDKELTHSHTTSPSPRYKKWSGGI